MTRPSGRPVLLDTCALIFIMNDRSFPPSATARLEEAEEGPGVYVSPVSAWEIGLLARPRPKRASLVFAPDPVSWFDRAMKLPSVLLAPLTSVIAIRASCLPDPLHGDPADRMLIATAREMGIDIVTSDSLILAYGAAGHVGVVAC